MALEDEIRTALDKELSAGSGSTATVTFRLTKAQIDAVISAQKALFVSYKTSPVDAVRSKAEEIVQILTDWEKS